MKKKLSLLAVGLIMGFTHFIPGVSCGTVGFMSNLYRETAAAIANIREYFSQSMKILLPLILGILAAVFLGLTVGRSFFTAYEAPLRYFFLGATLGCLPLLLQKTVRPKWDIWSLIPFAVGLILAILCYFWTPQVYPIEFNRFDAKTFFLMFGSAAFGSAAMMLPGFNTIDMIHLFHCDMLYQLILTEHEIFLLLPVLFGCAFGFIGTAWLITLAFSKRPQLIYALLTACFLGFLPTLIGSFSQVENKALCLILAAVGAFLSYWSSSHLKLAPEDMLFTSHEEKVKEYHIHELEKGSKD